MSSRLGTKGKMKQVRPLPFMALIFSQEGFVSSQKKCGYSWDFGSLLGQITVYWTVSL